MKRTVLERYKLSVERPALRSELKIRRLLTESCTHLIL